MSSNRLAPRYKASSFPGITGVRLAPYGGDATLVNISSSGLLVECASRVSPGMPLTILFEGTFTPPSIEARAVRCEVAGIGGEGSLRYSVGLVFSRPIQLDDQLAPKFRLTSEPPPLRLVPQPQAAPLISRNHW